MGDASQGNRVDGLLEAPGLGDTGWGWGVPGREFCGVRGLLSLLGVRVWGEWVVRGPRSGDIGWGCRWVPGNGVVW